MTAASFPASAELGDFCVTWIVTPDRAICLNLFLSGEPVGPYRLSPTRPRVFFSLSRQEPVARVAYGRIEIAAQAANGAPELLIGDLRYGEPGNEQVFYGNLIDQSPLDPARADDPWRGARGACNDEAIQPAPLPVAAAPQPAELTSSAAPCPPLSTFKDVTRDNYAALTAGYVLYDAPLPPAPTWTAAVVLRSPEGDTSSVVPVQDGYRAESARVVGLFRGKALRGVIGQRSFSLVAAAAPGGSAGPAPAAGAADQSSAPVWAQGEQDVALDGEPGVPVAIPDTGDPFWACVTIRCALSEERFAAWQVDVFRRVMLARAAIARGQPSARS